MKLLPMRHGPAHHKVDFVLRCKSHQLIAHRAVWNTVLNPAEGIPVKIQNQFYAGTTRSCILNSLNNVTIGKIEHRNAYLIPLFRLIQHGQHTITYSPLGQPLRNRQDIPIHRRPFSDIKCRANFCHRRTPQTFLTFQDAIGILCRPFHDFEFLFRNGKRHIPGNAQSHI